MKSLFKNPEFAFLGFNEIERKTYLSQLARSMHTHIVGATGVGKTESVLLPLILNDIFNSRSVIFIDPKGDNETFEILGSICNQAGRPNSLVRLDLARPEVSANYNPLKIGSPSALKDKIVGSIIWTEEYYKKVAERLLLDIFDMFRVADQPTSLADLNSLLNYPEQYELSGKKISDEAKASLEDIRLQLKTGRNIYEGIKTDIKLWTKSDFGSLLQRVDGSSCFDWMESGKIVYINLNTLGFEETARRFGRLVIQDIKTAVQNLQSLNKSKRKPCSVYIDEFASVASSGFIELLNKARSANVQLTLAHQSLGDLDAISPSFRNQILDNTNNKFLFRLDGPESAEFFAKLIGTRKSIKLTHQINNEVITGQGKTGLGSTREAEEFVVSPNELKKLKRGEAILLSKIPYSISKIKLNSIRRWIDFLKSHDREEEKMISNYKLYVCIILVALVCSDCSTIGKSTAAGAGIGGTVGLIAGSFLSGDDSSKPQRIIIGTAAGATLGALSGALIHKTMEDREREAFEKGKTSKDKGSNRSSIVASGTHSESKRYFPPRIERRWLEDEIRGNTLVEAHYEQVIVEEGHWE